MKFKFFNKALLLILIFSFTLVTKAIVFNLARESSLPTSQRAIASGDLNKDGIPDLIIGGDPIEAEQGKIRVLIGNGNGTFQTPAAYQIGYNPNEVYRSPFVNQIEIADLNNDGNLDVIVSHNGTLNFLNASPVYLTILWGNGDGTLQTTDSFVFSNETGTITVNSIDIGDINGDGKNDVVLGGSISSETGRIYILENLGNRNFRLAYLTTIGASINQISTGDFNRDNYLDLIMTTPVGVVIKFGNGNFTFSNITQRNINIHCYGLVVKDLNADGRTDFAVTDRFNQKIYIFLINRVRIPSVPVTVNTQFVSNLLETSDLNGDGTLDFYIADNFDPVIQVLNGDGTGHFTETQIVESKSPISSFTTADFDRNGKLDIAYSSPQESPARQAGIILNAPNSKRYHTDFDGDGKADISVFRPASGIWYIQQSSGGFTNVQFGINSDKIVPADYDGDGKTDVAVYRSGVWYLQRSRLGFTGLAFGDVNDLPVQADYDGDGKSEIAVYRPNNGTWYIFNLETNQNYSIAFGQQGDKPVPADYDGDGKTDIAVYRSGIWYLQRTRDGFTGIAFGQAEDKPVAGDYDGDGKADIAVFRPSNGTWYLQRSQLGFTYMPFGIVSDAPAPADYDGDGKSDVAVFRNGDWYLQQSTQEFMSIVFGTISDKAIANSFVP